MFNLFKKKKLYKVTYKGIGSVVYATLVDAKDEMQALREFKKLYSNYWDVIDIVEYEGK